MQSRSSQHVIIHGRLCVRRDGRYFAVDHEIHQTGTADVIARKSGPTDNQWARVQRSARGDHAKRVLNWHR